jgi:hypothetical protein
MVDYVIGHWTAGNYTPCIVDKNSYQLLIDGEAAIHEGKPVGAAASCGGMNSITYNIACCGGLARTPLKKAQCERFFKECAKALKKYNLPVRNFYTHAEIGQMVKDETITKLLPYNKYLRQNVGKVDLTKIPYDTGSKSNGDFIRNKIQWYMDRL